MKNTQFFAQGLPLGRDSTGGLSSPPHIWGYARVTSASARGQTRWHGARPTGSGLGRAHLKVAPTHCAWWYNSLDYHDRRSPDGPALPSIPTQPRRGPGV